MASNSDQSASESQLGIPLSQLLSANSEVFVVRIWCEGGELTQLGPCRGRMEHVRLGTRHYFNTPNELITHLNRYITCPEWDELVKRSSQSQVPLSSEIWTWLRRHLGHDSVTRRSAEKVKRDE